MISFVAHRRNRTSRNHVLQDKVHMPRQKPASGPLHQNSQVSTPGKVVCTEKCEKHPDRLVEFYCWDDKMLGCTVCMTMKHRSCKGVNDILELTDKLIDCEEYKQFINSLEDLKSRSQNLMKSTTDNELKVEKWFDDTASTLQEVRQKMNEAFDKCEKKLKAKANSVKSADKKTMGDIATKAKAVFDEVETISAELQSLQSRDNLGQLFIQMKKLEDRVQTLHKLLTEADADNRVTAYRLELGVMTQQILDDPASIGTLAIQDSDRLISPPSTTPTAKMNTTRPSTQQARTVITAPIATNPRNMKAKPVRDIQVRTNSDTADRCDIMGSAMMPGNKLDLTDYKNSTVKLVNLHTSKVTSELKTSCEPWDVTDISSDQIAVTLKDHWKILFVKVTDKLKQDREIAVNGDCTAVVYSRGKMIVAFCYPIKIEIMCPQGRVERKIQQPGMFKSLSHMVLGPGHDSLYVSDFNSCCVKRITLDGTVLAEYQDNQMSCPRGLAVDQQGRVLVCGAWSHNIHLLTADLAKVKLLTKNGLHFPQSLSYCHSTGMLYVGMVTDKVKVFRLS